MGNRHRSEERDLVHRALHRRGETERSGDRQIFSFLHGDHDIAIADRRADLFALHVDAIENAETVEVPLRFEDRRIAERIAAIDLRLLQHHVAIGVCVPAHHHLVDFDLRPLGNHVGHLRRGLVGGDFLTRLDLYLDVSAIAVERLQ